MSLSIIFFAGQQKNNLLSVPIFVTRNSVGKKNGHRFASNMYDFYMNLTLLGRGVQDLTIKMPGGGLGQGMTLKWSQGEPGNKMCIILPQTYMISV